MESENKSNEHRRVRFDSKSRFDSYRNQQNGQSNYRQTNNQSYHKPRPTQQRPQTAFTIEAEVDEDEIVEANTLFGVSFSCDPLRNSRLTRVETKISLGQHEFNLPMLLDSGATASFININKLPSTMAETVKHVIAGNQVEKSFGLERIEVRIKSALSCESIACARGKVRIGINSWSGEHDPDKGY
ncbi:unnamed protein product [Brachionus calyciflorus]|uniref:Uncharacterized protein n=1 Tax=Brachionus calyciflorus TaxID=104777 RepID=A0A813ZDA8_9BILA|nr:unnamed protein product [Brachionus calyciflorus]